MDNTIYYFRVCALNSKGTSKSSIRSFTTSSPGSSPVSTAAAATSVSLSTATLNGDVTPNGLATDAWFEWGKDPALSSYNRSTSQSISSGTTNNRMNEPLTGLSAGTTYYCRLAGSNAVGTTRGTIESFTAITGTLGFYDDFNTDTHCCPVKGC